MKFKLIPKIKAEATLMMVLVLLNLTGCPFKKANEVANEVANEDKNEVANEDKNEVANEDKIIILTKEKMDNLFKNLGKNPVTSAEFEYTIGENTSKFKCDSVDSIQSSTVQSKIEWLKFVALDILKNCTNSTEKKSEHYGNFRSVGLFGQRGRTKQSFTFKNGLKIRVITEESDKQYSQDVYFEDDSIQKYSQIIKITRGPEKRTENVNMEVMDTLMQRVKNKQLVRAEFMYLIGEERKYFTCDFVEHDPVNNTKSVKQWYEVVAKNISNTESVEQWNAVVAKNILKVCIKNATKRTPPDPDFIQNMKAAREVVQIFNFKFNKSKIKVTSHLRLTDKPAYTHTFEDDEYIYTAELKVW